MNAASASHPILSRLRWPWVHVLGTLLLVLGGCSTQEARPLRVGLSLYPPYELMVLAREAGYFRDAGLDVRLVEFDDLSDAQRAYEQGKLDGLATTLVEVLVSRSASQRDLRVVRAISRSDGADMILARADVSDLRQLKGQRIGLETGSLGHYLLARALEHHGMALPDVVAVSLEQDAMHKALAAGEVRAVVTYPPHAASMLASGTVRKLFSSQDIPGEVIDVYAFDRSVAEGRAHDLKRFFAALDRAAERLARDRAGSCAIMARREHVTADVFCATLEQGIRLIPPEHQVRYLGPDLPLRATVQTVHRTLARSGLVPPGAEIADCLQVLAP